MEIGGIDLCFSFERGKNLLSVSSAYFKQTFPETENGQRVESKSQQTLSRPKKCYFKVTRRRKHFPWWFYSGRALHPAKFAQQTHTGTFVLDAPLLAKGSRQRSTSLQWTKVIHHDCIFIMNILCPVEDDVIPERPLARA